MRRVRVFGVRCVAVLLGVGAALSMGAFTSGCSGGGGTAPTAGDESFPSAAYVSSSSDTGAIHVDVRLAPSQPPARGLSTVELTVERASGEPVDGLDLDIVPWMPAHGHGASLRPSVTPKGGGKYLVSDVNLFMPGRWELRTTISGSVSDHVAPVIAVP
jgi:hypothetical protein